MSLINDALKKAQKQRTGESAPLAGPAVDGGANPARMGQRRARPASNVPVLQIALGAGAVLLFVVGCVFLVQFLINRPVTPLSPPRPAPVVEAAPKSVETVPAKPAPTVATTFVLPTAAPATTPPPAAVTPPPVVQPQPAAVVAAVVVPPPAPEPAKPAAPPKMDNKAVNFIESLHVAGIRASSTDSKVLMNDRVYRVGNIVEHEMGLKLTEITSSSLSFADEHGATYTRNF